MFLPGILLLCDLLLLTLARPRTVDLSRPYEQGMTTYPKFHPYKMHPTLISGTTNEVRSEWIETETHLGTHMDAPVQTNSAQVSIDEFTPDDLVKNAVVVDVKNKSLAADNYQVTVEDLQDWERDNDNIPSGSVVLINTGWADKYDDPEEYLGSKTDPSKFNWPGLSEEGANFLVNDRQVVGVGLDTVSLDAGSGIANTTAHRIIQKGRRFIIENMVNLTLLPATKIKLYAFPIRLTNASAAPARVVAFFDQN